MDLPPVPQGWRRVLLIRHGETDANRKGIVQGCRVNVDLNEKGLAQARDLSSFLSAAKFNVKLICTSALERAKQTASYIVSGSRKTMELKELNEMDYGEKWDGVDVVKIMTELKALATRWAKGETSAACPDGGESPMDVLDRAKRALSTVVQAMESDPDDDAVAVIVAHNFVNKVLLSHSETGSVSNMHRFEQQHTCVNVLDVERATGKVRVVQTNFHKHVSRL